MTRQNIADKKKSQVPLSLFYVNHLILGIGSILKYGLSMQWDSFGKKLTFSWPMVIDWR